MRGPMWRANLQRRILSWSPLARVPQTPRQPLRPSNDSTACAGCTSNAEFLSNLADDFGGGRGDIDRERIARLFQRCELARQKRRRHEVAFARRNPLRNQA